MITCVNHPNTAAAFKCRSCGKGACEYCTLQAKNLGSCAGCGGSMMKLEAAAPRSPDPYESSRYSPPAPSFTPPEAPKESGSGMNWLWFILIYGVGNLILYKTTGILLIPIPRK